MLYYKYSEKKKRRYAAIFRSFDALTALRVYVLSLLEAFLSPAMGGFFVYRIITGDYLLSDSCDRGVSLAWAHDEFFMAV